MSMHVTRTEIDLCSQQFIYQGKQAICLPNHASASHSPLRHLNRPSRPFKSGLPVGINFTILFKCLLSIWQLKCIQTGNPVSGRKKGTAAKIYGLFFWPNKGHCIHVCSLLFSVKAYVEHVFSLEKHLREWGNLKEMGHNLKLEDVRCFLWKESGYVTQGLSCYFCLNWAR